MIVPFLLQIGAATMAALATLLKQEVDQIWDAIPKVSKIQQGAQEAAPERCVE
jgi:hypothetical protein